MRGNVAALAAYGLPALLVFAWLEPIVSETRSHNPTTAERAGQLRHYAHDLVVHSQHSFHLAPSMASRAGAIAVAALVLVPLAGLASRRRWSALVLGGSVLVLGLELWSLLFPHFSDLVSLSQSRRAVGFVPFAFALAGGAAVLTRFLRLAVLPVALAAGIVVQLSYPHGVGWPAWVALFGGLAALALTAVRPRLSLERPGPVAALAVALFALPVVVHGFSHWHAAVTNDPRALSPGLVQFLRHDVPRGSIVFADLETSYRISAYAPVYVCAAPPAHVADTKANAPETRRAAWLAFLGTGDLAIPRRYDAGWLVLRRQPAGRPRRGTGRASRLPGRELHRLQALIADHVELVRGEAGVPTRVDRLHLDRIGAIAEVEAVREPEDVLPRAAGPVLPRTGRIDRGVFVRLVEAAKVDDLGPRDDRGAARKHSPAHDFGRQEGVPPCAGQRERREVDGFDGGLHSPVAGDVDGDRPDDGCGRVPERRERAAA